MVYTCINCPLEVEAIKNPTRVRFSINGGPEHVSKNFYFNDKSLTVRSTIRVERGDKITTRIEYSSSFSGVVEDSFDDRFIVPLNPAPSKSAVVSSKKGSAEYAGLFPPGRTSKNSRTTSFVFPLDGETPSWARLSSIHSKRGGGERHRLSIMTIAALDIDAIRSVWLSIDEMRWVARVASAGKKTEKTMLVILLNGWQLHMAAIYGLSISILFNGQEEWAVNGPAAPFLKHLDIFAPEIEFLSA